MGAVRGDGGCGLRGWSSRHVSASSEDARGLKHGEAVRDCDCGWVWACLCVCWRACKKCRRTPIFMIPLSPHYLYHP